MSGFGGLLFLLFLCLKLTSTIDWSWWWIMAPLWGGLLIDGAAFYAWIRFVKKVMS